MELACLTRTIDPSLFELNAAGALNGHVPDNRRDLVDGRGGGLRPRLFHDCHGARRLGRRGHPVRRGRQRSTINGASRASASASSRTCSRPLRRGSATDLLFAALPSSRSSGCFAELPRYHRIFRSCNRAFALTGATDGWCNDCPKCRFVYLMLATALGREELVGIFGSDLLGDPEQIDGFRDLFEIDRKPFECVGTRDESIEALSELAGSSHWAGSVVVEALKPHLELEDDCRRRMRASVCEALARAGARDRQECCGFHRRRWFDGESARTRYVSHGASTHQVGLTGAGDRGSRLLERPARRDLGYRPRGAGHRASGARTRGVGDDRAGPAR